MTERELVDVLPGGALRRYFDYWRPTTDAPGLYLVAGALVTVGSLLQTKTYVAFGGQPVYPNLWMLLLGPSSTFRKTTCVSKARITVGNVKAELLMPEEFSREALVRHLSQQPTGLLTSSEFGGMLASLSRDYMAGTKELLADLYDAPEKYSRVIGRERLDVQRPCPSMFAASQTGWFLEKVKEIDLQSGFLARFLYMPAFEKPPSIAIPPDPDPQLGGVLYEELNALLGVEGRLSLGPKVLGRYARWLEQHENDLLKEEQVERLSPFWTRLSVTTLKIAMILQVATNQSLDLTPDTLERAIALAEFFKSNLKKLFLSEFTFTRDMANKQKLYRLIAKRGLKGIERRELMRASNLLKKDFDPIIATLEEEGLVVSNRQGTNGYTQQTHYIVTDSQLLAAA